MNLECASCGAEEQVDAVCHHCGKPLCQDTDNCRFLIADTAFESPSMVPIMAIHCRECRDEVHPPTPLRQWSFAQWLRERFGR